MVIPALALVVVPVLATAPGPALASAGSGSGSAAVGPALVAASPFPTTALGQLGSAVSPYGSAATAASGTPGVPGVPATRPDGADVRACGALPRFPAGTAAQIMAGRLTIAPFNAVTIDPDRNGGVDWAMNPYDDPTWVLDFQTGTWIDALVEVYLAGGPRAAGYRARAKAILAGWLADVPPANRNPETLMCATEAFPGQALIHDRVPVLLDYYAAHWEGAYNHGLSEDLELLRAGCAYPASEWGGQPLSWRRLARQQMIESFLPNRYGPAVDPQGATNEQATGYANFTFGLWTTAEADLAACGEPPLPAADRDRIARMATFLAQRRRHDQGLDSRGPVRPPPARADQDGPQAGLRGTACELRGTACGLRGLVASRQMAVLDPSR